jgi:hypothetical protein
MQRRKRTRNEVGKADKNNKKGKKKLGEEKMERKNEEGEAKKKDRHGPRFLISTSTSTR